MKLHSFIAWISRTGNLTCFWWSLLFRWHWPLVPWSSGPLVYLILVIPYVSIQLLTAWSPWTSDSRHKSEKWYFLQIFFQNQVKEYFWSFCIVLRWTESDLNLELSERRAEFPWDVSGRSHRVSSSLLWLLHVWHLWILWLSWQCDQLWHLPLTGLTLDYCSLLSLLLLQGSGQL